MFKMITNILCKKADFWDTLYVRFLENVCLWMLLWYDKMEFISFFLSLRMKPRKENPPNPLKVKVVVVGGGPVFKGCSRKNCVFFFHHEFSLTCDRSLASTWLLLVVQKLANQLVCNGSGKKNNFSSWTPCIIFYINGFSAAGATRRFIVYWIFVINYRSPSPPSPWVQSYFYVRKTFMWESPHLAPDAWVGRVEENNFVILIHKNI